jgi:glutathione peroxidase
MTNPVFRPTVPLAALGLVLLLSAPVVRAAAPAPAVSTAAAAACPATLQHRFPRLQDEKDQNLCQYAGRVLLVVNTASYCGYTGQYEGLEALHARYKDKGLVVLGFPSNDFNQESTDNKKIADFCASTYGVKFPMFARTSVKGPQASPFYRQLADKTGTAPGWNFFKYLIGRNGEVISAYPSSVEPGDKRLVAQIEKQLALAAK